MASATGACRFTSSSIGKKQIMALTGLVWCGFVFTHMLGNLLILVGPDVYNEYSHKLTSNPLIYMAEAFLVVTLFFHVVSAIQVTIKNKLARPVKYAVSPQVKGRAPLSSRSMSITGALLLCFLVLHLLEFKFGTFYETNINGQNIRDLYKLADELFHVPTYLGWYIFSLIVLFFHLKHAFFSSLQSLGWAPPALECKIRCASMAFGALVSLGFLVGPLFFILKG